MSQHLFLYERGPLLQEDTSALVMQTVMTLAVPVVRPEPLVLDFRATVQAQYTAPSATFLGAALQILWDGVPLPEWSYFEHDPATLPSIDTIAENVGIRALVAAPTVGPHTLEVQWQVLDSDELATLFPGGATVTAEGK